MSEKMTSVELKSYYSGLSKKEKGELLRHLVKKFDYSYSSVQQKLHGNADLNARDIILIGNEVEDESWKS